ncbi:MAG: Hemolysin C [bacterium ADurb.Bin429]|nr:MAG: Hemolysin C [bacterium ADurb.Bin429]
MLYAKDLLPVLAGAGLDEPVERRARRAHFVPETMTLADFMNFSQRSHAHIAVVADEYGGTEGLVTLQDAIREVVGDVGDDDEEEEFYFEEAGEGLYRVDGTFSLDELEKLTGISVDDEEHTTVAGFLMAKFEKIPETGDEMEYSGVHFRIEETDGKRVTRVLLRTSAGQAPAADAGGDAP